MASMMAGQVGKTGLGQTLGTGIAQAANLDSAGMQAMINADSRIETMMQDAQTLINTGKYAEAIQTLGEVTDRIDAVVGDTNVALDNQTPAIASMRTSIANTIQIAKTMINLEINTGAINSLNRDMTDILSRAVALQVEVPELENMLTGVIMDIASRKYKTALSSLVIIFNEINAAINDYDMIYSEVKELNGFINKLFTFVKSMDSVAGLNEDRIEMAANAEGITLVAMQKDFIIASGEDRKAEDRMLGETEIDGTIETGMVGITADKLIKAAYVANPKIQDYLDSMLL